MLMLRNGDLLDTTGVFSKGDIIIDGDRIVSVGTGLKAPKECQVIDLGEKKVIPGFIDIHTHGALGYDIMTATSSQFSDISRYLAKNGTTAFLPTTITADTQEIIKVIQNINDVYKKEYSGAAIEGIHIEGPFINSLHKGCHLASMIKLPDARSYEEFKKAANGLKIHMTIAPEMDGGLALIEQIKNDGNTVSIGHTDAVYDMVNRAIDAGAASFTHLFNAMRGIHHREPGTVGAGLASDAFVEVICDGIHVHPEVVKMIYRIKGCDRVVLVTDAMQAVGLGDGEFIFGGFKVKVENGIVRNEEGALAGSTLSMFRAVKNIMRFTGVSLGEAVLMATINPARVIGIDGYTGSLESGKRADIVIIDDNIEIHSVYCKGILI